MNNFLKKYRETIAILVYAALIGSVVYFVVLPLKREITNRRDGLQEEISNKEGKQKKILEIPKIKEQYLTVQSESKDMEVLLKRDDAVILMERLEKLADETGNEIKIGVLDNDPNGKIAAAAKSKAKTDKNKEPAKTIVDQIPTDTDLLEIKISLIGNFNDIVKFVDRLENMEYYSDIIGIEIKKNDTKTTVESPLAVPDPFAAKQTEQKAADPNKLIGELDTVFYLKK
jgi:hypothetical protein